MAQASPAGELTTTVQDAARCRGDPARAWHMVVGVSKPDSGWRTIGAEMRSDGVPVGTVTGLWRYPVKSMAAEVLTTACVSWAGVTGDRRWALVRPGSGSNGFPWHTIRENSAMWTYMPRLLNPDRPDKSQIEVRTPDGSIYDLTDPRLAGELGAGLRIMRLDRGLFDAMPVSLITTATASALCDLAGVPANELRFRPNIVIAPAGGAPYAEEAWVGSILRIGEAAVRVDRRDSRCVIVNVNPRTGQPDGPVLKVIGQYRRTYAGVYGTTVQPGRLKVGDAVTIGRR